VTYDLTPKFSVEGSLRYVSEVNGVLFTLPAKGANHLQEGRTLPSVTISYKLDGGGNVYARYAEGWKAGGNNVVVSPFYFTTDVGAKLKPESVKTYEVGLKDNLFGNKAQYTTDVFWNEDNNLQTAGGGGPAANPAVIYTVQNAGNARTYGWEGTFNYRIVPELTLGLSVGYLEAEYLNFSQLNCNTVVPCFNFNHTRMLWSPKWQGGITLDYDQPLNDKYRLVASWLTSFVDSSIGDTSTTPGPDNNYIPGYSVTNVRIGIHTTDDKYAFTIFAKNLFDKFYGVFIIGPGGPGGKAYVPGDRRIIGGELEYKF
jgi:iron complex outermembrane receptor protein